MVCVWPQQAPAISHGSVLSSLPSFSVRRTGSGSTTPNQYSHFGLFLRVGGDSQSAARDARVSSSSPLTTSGIMHGSPLSDDSSWHSDSGILNDGISSGVVSHMRPRALDNALYLQCVSAMCTLAKDPSLRIAALDRRGLSIIRIQQLVAKLARPSSSGVRLGETTIPQTNNLAGLARSSSWFDVNGGKHLTGCIHSYCIFPPCLNWKLQLLIFSL